MFPLFILGMLENLEQRIIDLVHEGIKVKQLNHCFLVDVHTSGRKIEVFIDADKGVRFADCKALSRFIEEDLDKTGVVGTNYILEVSSPGAERPLKMPRQYPQHIGRKISVNLRNGHQVEGLLKSVEKEGINIEIEVKKEKLTERVLFDNIKESKILVTFHK